MSRRGDRWRIARSALVASLLLGLGLGLGLCTTSAAAAPDPTHDAHVGINMRTDLGTHMYRLGFGVRWYDYEAVLVLDPNSSRDGQTDVDAVFSWWLRPSKWALMVGWRNTAFNLLGQNRWHENLLLGTIGRLPSLGTRWVRVEAGLELQIDVVRHGSNVPAEWISFSSTRAFDDLINLHLFIRIKFVVPF